MTTTTSTQHVVSSAHSDNHHQHHHHHYHHYHNYTNQPSTFPLSSDHLLHLIQYNVLRALLTNKFSLNLHTPLTDDPTSIACPISGVYHTVDPPHLTTDPSFAILPPSLYPTPLQKNHDHPIWVNAMPFPRVRDNFIRHAGLFNPWELLYDLVGEFMSNTPAACVASHPKPTTTAAIKEKALAHARSFSRSSSITLSIGGGGGASDSSDSGMDVDDDTNHHFPDQVDDEVTTGRSGLIVWGEPHDAQSWEVTPGFLARWAWALEGCEEELVETSNRWRVRRGAEPMRLSILRR